MVPAIRNADQMSYGEVEIRDKAIGWTRKEQ